MAALRSRLAYRTVLLNTGDNSVENGARQGTCGRYRVLEQLTGALASGLRLGYTRTLRDIAVARPFVGCLGLVKFRVTE
ncbi:MAG: hypothetical protein JWO42_3091, partial [Chloroflexi bacterium]|nr:hypothetical protein [Chloroflexota bacterium]